MIAQRTTPVAAVPRGIGGAVAIAQRALLPLLGDAAATAGMAISDWFGLSRLARLESSVTNAAFRDDLANALESDELADAVIANLRRADLVTTAAGHGSATIALTAAGVAVHQRISTVLEEQTAELLEPFDPDDIEVTVRTLLAIVDRAHAMQGK